MIEILIQQADDIEVGLWHIQIGGLAADGKYRLGPISVLCDDPQQWLDNHQGEAQTLVDAGEHNPLREAKIDFDALAELADSEVSWLEGTIPTIETMTLEELRGLAKRLAQENLYQIKAWRYMLRRFA